MIDGTPGQGPRQESQGTARHSVACASIQGVLNGFVKEFFFFVNYHLMSIFCVDLERTVAPQSDLLVPRSANVGSRVIARENHFLLLQASHHLILCSPTRERSELSIDGDVLQGVSHLSLPRAVKTAIPKKAEYGVNTCVISRYGVNEPVPPLSAICFMITKAQQAPFSPRGACRCVACGALITSLIMVTATLLETIVPGPRQRTPWMQGIAVVSMVEVKW